jgi:uncharacterized HAD superfamily protein
VRIGFDIDGVLADFNTSFIALVKEVTGKDLFGPGYWPTTWDYPQSVGYTNEECSLAWNRIKTGGAFWRNLAPLSDTRVLRQWYFEADPVPLQREIGYHEFYFITSRMGKNVKLQTEEWLDEQMEVAGNTVLISSEKGALCKALKLDFYVDDRAENIKDVETTSPSTQAYLINQPWNQHMSTKIRINELSEFLKAIDQHQLLPAVA